MTGPALKVIAGGLNSTVQDLGRPGYQSLGLPVAGALDWVNLRLANRLVGNREGAACLEISYLGPTLEVAAESVRVALVGTRAGIEVIGGNSRSGANESIHLVRGQRFRVAGFSDSAVAYLAFEGGIAVPVAQGSRSTLIRVRLGGFEGRAIAAGDLLPLGLMNAPARPEVRLPLELPARLGRFRVVLGPQDDLFTAAQQAQFLGATYTVSRASDRMGARLEGPAFPHQISIVSDAIAPGAVQVPGNGLPIVLLADRQTTGGYPKIATVISADLPFLGRLGPGSEIGFVAITVVEAEAVRRALEAEIARVAERLETISGAAVLDEQRLLNSNLVSGVVDAREDASVADKL